jgi:hypothetical protein
MKKLFFIAVALMNSIIISSQELSFELRYPVPFGDNFLNSNFIGRSGYNGIIDIGAAYKIKDISNFGFGMSYNTSLFSHPVTDVSIWTIMPKAFIEYLLHMKRVSIAPRIGVGYSHWIFKIPDSSSETSNGFSLNGSAKAIFNNDKKVNFFILVAYEFTRFGKSDDEVDISFNRNVHLFYPGAGITWNIGK